MLRKGILVVALGVLAALLVLLAPERAEEILEARGALISPRPAAPLPASPLRLPERQPLGKARGELFATPRQAPALPAADAAQPAQPAAPPLPYRFAGVVRQGKDAQVLIARGDAVHAVKPGETLDGSYRVASIGAESIELVYLPLGSVERIAITSALDPAPARESVAPAPAARSEPAASGDAAAAEMASLHWKGPSEVRAGSSVSVALHLSYDRPVRAAPMQLRFEPGVLEPLSVRPGRFLDSGQFSYRVSADGSILVGASAASALPGENAELLVVTFRPARAGAVAGLRMATLDLRGARGEQVAYAHVADYRAPIVP